MTLAANDDLTQSQRCNELAWNLTCVSWQQVLNCWWSDILSTTELQLGANALLVAGDGMTDRAAVGATEMS